MSPERKSKRRKSLDDMLSKGRKGLRETIDSAAHVTAGLRTKPGRSRARYNANWERTSTRFLRATLW